MWLAMDLEEARRKLYTRVQSLDPENVFKIMGYLLLQDWEEQEMLRLALSSDIVLHSLIVKAKKELGLVSSTPKQMQFSSPQQSPRLSSFSTNIASRASQHLQLGFCQTSTTHTSSITSDLYAKDQSFAEDAALAVAQRMQLELTNTSYDRGAGNERLVLLKDNQLTCSVPLLKPCLYFSRGYCKNGNSCRFIHDVGLQSFVHYVDGPLKLPDSAGGAEAFQPESLETELRDLLRGRPPVPLATLPDLYYEKYGKLLEESWHCYGQKQENSDYGYSRLPSRLSNVVTILDWPNYGQQAVVLNDEAYKYRAYRGTLLENDCFNSSSRQIYLTFPAESTFTMQDVSIHFRAYGPVQDVRIPMQQKRMFGFVTFTYSETVRTVLSEGNPHYICGARVLVKPYKEKAKLAERKYLEKMEFLKNACVHNIDKSREFEALKLCDHVLRRQILLEKLEPLNALKWRFGQLNIGDNKNHMVEMESLNDSRQVPITDEETRSDDSKSKTEEKLHPQPSQYDWVLDVLNTSEGCNEVNSSHIYQEELGRGSNGISLPSVSCPHPCDVKNLTSPTFF